MAATFTVQDITKESATVVVSGIVAGTTIRFYLCSVEDPDNFFFDDEHIATSTAMSKPYTGLSPGTEYAVNVKPDPNGEWLGKQTFFTEALPVVDANGKLIRTPLLYANYPLFDWDDWPDSYDALVSGGLTSEFEKECWNDIVDTLYDALVEAGLEWDDKYTTRSGARITEVYGDLYADAFNSIRHNIERPAPFGFKWAYDPTFRGYTGRADFRGVDAVGEKSADDVYPEYFKELVRRLNLLIDILRCNGYARAFWGDEVSFSDSYNKAIRQAPSVRFRLNEIAASDYYNKAIRRGRSGVMRVDPFGVVTDYTRGIYVGRGGPMVVDPFGTTTRYVNLMRRGVPVYLETDEKLVATDFVSEIRAGESALVWQYENSFTDSTGLIRLGLSALVRYFTPVLTSVEALGRTGTSAQVARAIETASNSFAAYRAGISAMVRTDEVLAKSTTFVDALRGMGRRFKPQVVSRVIILPDPIRAGTGRTLNPGPQVVRTPSVNLMRGGIPIYLETSKSLLDTSTWANYLSALSAFVRVLEIAEANTHVLLRASESLRMYTDKPSVLSEGILDLRLGDPLQLLGRGISSTEKSRGWYQAAAAAFVLGRGLSDTVVAALCRVAEPGAFTVRSISTTELSRANTLAAETKLVLGRGCTGTELSRLLGHNGKPGRMFLHGESSTEESQAVLRESPPAAMQLRGLSATDTTGLVSLGAAIKPQSVVHTSATGSLVLGAALDDMHAEVNTSEAAQPMPATGASIGLYSVSRTTYTRITFAASERVDLELVPGKVATYAKQLIMQLAQALGVDFGEQQSRTQFKPVVVRGAQVVSVQPKSDTVSVQLQKPKAIAGLKVLVEGVPETFTVKNTAPMVLTGIPVYGTFIAESMATSLQASGIAVLAKWLEATDKPKTSHAVAPRTSETSNVRGTGTTTLLAQFTTEAKKIAAAMHQSAATTRSTGSFGTAWYPPVWVAGGLWIRQSHSVTQNENGELVIV